MNKRIKYNKYDSGNAFFLSIVAPQVVGLAVMLVLMLVASFAGTSYKNLLANDFIYAGVAIVSQLTFVAVFFWYNKKANVNWVKATNIKDKVNWLNIVLCVVIAFVCVFGLNGFVSLFDELVRLVGYKADTSLPLPLNNAGWLIFNLVGLAILPAIFEELLFRGIIFNGLKDYGKNIAIFGSAALFALLHGNVSQLLYPFILGIILGFVVYKTGNILYSIIIHLTNNMIVVVYNYIYNLTNPTQQATQLPIWLIFVYIGAMIVSLAIIFVIVKFCLRKKQQKTMTFDDIQTEEQTQQIKNVPNNFMKYGIIIGIILWILDFCLGFMG